MEVALQDLGEVGCVLQGAALDPAVAMTDREIAIEQSIAAICVGPRRQPVGREQAIEAGRGEPVRDLVVDREAASWIGRSSKTSKFSNGMLVACAPVMPRSVSRSARRGPA